MGTCATGPVSAEVTAGTTTVDDRPNERRATSAWESNRGGEGGGLSKPCHFLAIAERPLCGAKDSCAFAEPCFDIAYIAKT